MLHIDINKRYCADRALRSEWLNAAVHSSVTSSEKKLAGSQILAYNV